VYKILELPAVYNLVQALFQTGQLKPVVDQQIRDYESASALELGAGTGVYSPAGFKNLVVTDISTSYLASIPVSCHRVTCSATELPFESKSFDLVFAVGLHHHLSDAEVLKSFQEAKRVLKNGGRLFVLDNIWPTNRLNLVAWLVRRLDRGRYVRSLRSLEQIARTIFSDIEIKTFKYAWCRLECVTISCRV
jgi:SAM-dependent methyltransferase